MTTASEHLSRMSGHATELLSGKAITQYGALCLRSDGSGELQVLLITTRETKRWTIPKGWPIDGLRPHKVAEREAWEEAGVKGRAKKRCFGHFSYLKRLADGSQVPAIVAVHLLDVRRMSKTFPEQSERKLAWMEPFDAMRLVPEPELQGLFRKLAARRMFVDAVFDGT